MHSSKDFHDKMLFVIYGKPAVRGRFSLKGSKSEDAEDLDI